MCFRLHEFCKNNLESNILPLKLHWKTVMTAEMDASYQKTYKWKPLGERDYFAKLEVKSWRWWRNEQSLLSDSIIDLDYNMSMSKVKDTVNLVLMHQMKSVQWVEYYLWLNITTIAENTWPWPLTYDLDLFAWPWPLCLTLRLIYCYIVLWRQKK